MRESEHPDMFPMQERNAVDGYARRVARNSTLSDIAAVGAADALIGYVPDEEPDGVPEAPSAPPAGPRAGSGEEHHADEDEGGQQHDGHTRDLPGAERA
jgi:hypothetical protein